MHDTRSDPPDAVPPGGGTPRRDALDTGAARPASPGTEGSMWAYALAGPGRFRRIEPPRPTAAQLRAGEVLLRVVAGGICGSDGPFFLGMPNRWSAPGSAGPTPGFPMHEVVGEVVATTDPDLAPGQRVVGWASAFDAVAEYVVTDARGVWAYSGVLPPEEEVLVQPLACVLSSVERLGDLSGRHCAVIGQGAIGLLFTHVLHAWGAASVTAVDRVDRSVVAEQVGADRFVWAGSGEWSGSLTEDERPGVVVEAVGHQSLTLQHSIDAVADGGQVFYFGVPDDPVYPLDMEAMIRKNLTLMSGGAVERRRLLAEAHDHLVRYPELVDLLVTHRFPVGEVQQAYDLAFRSPGERLKVVVSME